MDAIPGIDIDLAATDKQFGHLQIAASGGASMVAGTRVPVCVVQRGEGPTVAFLGSGRHDQPIGSITLRRLARQLQSSDLTGRVVILPELQATAPQAFPQAPRSARTDGTSARQVNATAADTCQVLQALVSESLLPASQLIVQLGSGGSRLCHAPTCLIALQGTGEQQAGAESAMIAFGAPNSLRLQTLPADDLTGTAVIQSGGQYLAARLGGGAAPDPAMQELALSGCMNILVSLGMLDAGFTLRATRMLRVPDARYTLSCPQRGMPALVREIGREVYRGEPVAQLFDPDDASAEPLDILSPVDGILMAGFQASIAEPGDTLALLADEVAR